MMAQGLANRATLGIPLPEVLFEKLLLGSAFQVLNQARAKQPVFPSY